MLSLTTMASDSGSIKWFCLPCGSVVCCTLHSSLCGWFLYHLILAVGFGGALCVCCCCCFCCFLCALFVVCCCCCCLFVCLFVFLLFLKEGVLRNGELCLDLKILLSVTGWHTNLYDGYIIGITRQGLSNLLFLACSSIVSWSCLVCSLQPSFGGFLQPPSSRLSKKPKIYCWRGQLPNHREHITILF